MNKNNLIIYILMLGTFGILTTEMGVVGILPEISAYFNVNLTQAGLFISMFSLVIAITSLFMPLFFSKFERKKTFITILSIFTIFPFLSIFIKDFYLALIFRMIPAFVHPVYCSIALTIPSDILPKEEAQNGIGKVIMGVSAGMIIGVPITTYVASYFNYQASLLWFSLINLIALILTIIYFPKISGKKESYGTQVSVAKTGIFIISAITVIFLNASLYIPYSYISELLGSLTNIAGDGLIITLFVYGVASIIGNYVGSRLLTIQPKKTILIYPFTLIIIFIVLYVVCRQVIPTMITVTLWGFVAGIGNDIYQYVMVSAAPNSQELANGVFISMGNVGITIGTTISGFIIMDFGVQITLLIAIIVLIMSFIIILVRTYKYNNKAI